MKNERTFVEHLLNELEPMRDRLTELKDKSALEVLTDEEDAQIFLLEEAIVSSDDYIRSLDVFSNKVDAARKKLDQVKKEFYYQ